MGSPKCDTSDDKHEVVKGGDFDAKPSRQPGAFKAGDTDCSGITSRATPLHSATSKPGSRSFSPTFHDVTVLPQAANSERLGELADALRDVGDR
jgi:hypothetical protein